MTPAAKPRVSDGRLVTMVAVCELERQPGHEPDNVTYRGDVARGLVLDLRDARAESARWRKCAEALAGAISVHYKPDPGEPGYAALARFDAMSVTLHANVQEPDGTVHSVTRDVNAAILRLQKRLDAVRPVVAAVRRLATYGFGEVGAVAFAYAALPDDVREWAQKGE